VPGRAGYRLSGWFHSDGGFIDRETPLQPLSQAQHQCIEFLCAASAFTYAPADGFTITPAVFLQHQHSDDSDQYWRSDLPLRDANKHIIGANIASPVTDDLKVYSLAVKYDFRGLSFQSDTSYTDRNTHDTDDWLAVLPSFFGCRRSIPRFPPTLHTTATSPRPRLGSRNSVWDRRFRYAPQLDRRGLLPSCSGEVSQRFSTVDPITRLPNVYGGKQRRHFWRSGLCARRGVTLRLHAFKTVDEQKACSAREGGGGGGGVNHILSHLRPTSVCGRARAIKDQEQDYRGPFYFTRYACLIPRQGGESHYTQSGSDLSINDSSMVYASAAKGYRLGGQQHGARHAESAVRHHWPISA